MTPRTGKAAPYCAHCAMHNHRNCTGCECADRGHNPGADLAAAMRRYERPDLAKLPVEKLASDWHRKEEARAA